MVEALSELPVESILGFPVSSSNRRQVLDCVLSWVRTADRCRYFACANPHSLEVANGDNRFRAALLSADLLIPDGVGIVLASRLLGGRIRDRVTGHDVFSGVLSALDCEGGRSVFFLGSSDENLARLREKMSERFPRVRVAGTYSPPFKADFDEGDNRRMVEAVNCAAPDILWVGMTAPKQEKWIFEHRESLHVAFAGPVGAVFDFFTGRVRRSHAVFQRLGLEWLPRLLQEPRRLWRRNLVSNPRFLGRVLRVRLSGQTELWN